MELLKSSGYLAMPWRNGGGITREILVHQDSRVHADFLWRVSIATIGCPGPFSRYEGVDRTIAALDGGGLAFWVEGKEHLLTPATPALSFAGEADAAVHVVRWPTSDLNVMTRRKYFSHRMTSRMLDGSETLQFGSGMTMLVFTGPAKIEGRYKTLLADRLDCLACLPEDVEVVLSAPSPGIVYEISIVEA